jgi:hypothetical protein
MKLVPGRNASADDSLFAENTKVKTKKAGRKKGQRPTSVDQTKDAFVRRILPKLAKDTITLSRMMTFEEETNIPLRFGVPCCLIFQDNVVQKPYAESVLTKLKSKPNYVLLASDKLNGKRLRDSIFKDNSDRKRVKICVDVESLNEELFGPSVARTNFIKNKETTSSQSPVRSCQVKTQATPNVRAREIL